jgi:hypothetical protein
MRSNSIVLITGAAGFIGFHLAKKLCDSGYTVLGIDNLNHYYDIGIKESRLNILKTLPTFFFEKVEEEITDMEAWKERISSGAFFQSVKGSVMFDPTTINSKILELTKEKITLENSLALVNSVQVIEGFTVFEKPTSPRLSVSLISGSLVGLTFVSVLIAFKSIRKLLRMADAAKETA